MMQETCQRAMQNRRAIMQTNMAFSFRPWYNCGQPIEGSMAQPHDTGLTLDEAHDRWASDRTLRTAKDYLATALVYTYDYMIGVDEFTAISQTVAKWLRSR